MDKYSDYQKASRLFRKMMFPYIVAQQHATVEAISSIHPMPESEKNALLMQMKDIYFRHLNEVNQGEMKVLMRFVRRYRKQIDFS